MAMVKSSLQPTGQIDSYNRKHIFAEASFRSLENRNPNVANERTMGTVKHNVPKSPRKPGNLTQGENDLRKPPFQGTVDIDDDKKVTAAKSPGISGGSVEVTKYVGTPLRKHFCSSPRCSANNPDYAVLVARTYLRSKRYLLPGQQSPASARAKVPISALIDGTCSSTFGAALGVSSQELVKEERREGFNESVQISEDIANVDRADGISAENFASGSLSSSKLEFGVTTRIVVLSSVGPVSATSTLQHDDEDRSTKKVEHRCMTMDRREALLQHEESIGADDGQFAEWRGAKSRPAEGSSHRRTHRHIVDREKGVMDGDCSTICSIQSTPMYMDDEHEKDMKSLNDACMQELPDDLSIHSIPPVPIGGSKTPEQPPVVSNSRDTMLDVSIVGIMALSGGTHIGRNFSMRLSRTGESLAGEDLRRSPVSPKRLSMRRCQRMRLRRFSTDSNSIACSKESVPLKRQAAIKRKQGRDWMWDSAVKDAVSRLASQGDGGVNVLVQAFESVNLTEKPLESSKYVNITGNVSQVDNISKTHASDESMAGEYRLSDRNVQQGRMGCGIGGFAHGSRLMSTMDCEDLGIVKLHSENIQQQRFPRLSSNLQSSELGSNKWASFKNADMDGINDACSLKGISSNSGAPDMLKWTYRRLSRSRCRTKYQRKRCTSLQPFKLRTEERGAVKEEKFSRRLQQLWAAEQQLRIPIAQGLPWTTDEPEVPPKPPAKMQTRVEGFRLETGFRAVERTEFDKYVAERQLQSELRRQEEARQRQFVTEEDIKRLRRQMVPRAQLMPYFDRPFMPHRSSKQLTVPKQPNFHHTQHKKARCSMVSCYANNNYVNTLQSFCYNQCKGSNCV